MFQSKSHVKHAPIENPASGRACGYIECSDGLAGVRSRCRRPAVLAAEANQPGECFQVAARVDLSYGRIAAAENGRFAARHCVRSYAADDREHALCFDAIQ